MSFVRFLRPVAVLTLLACASSANAQVVISQIYPAGNNSGATFNQKYVEIFNRGASAVSLANKTLQYASPTGTGNFAVHATLSGSIGPGQYQLIVYDSPGAIGANLPVTGDFPDSTGSTPGGASGKFILADSAAALACNGGSTPCSPAQTALILDLVGYGTANYFEGAAAAPHSDRNDSWLPRKQRLHRRQQQLCGFCDGRSKPPQLLNARQLVQSRPEPLDRRNLGGQGRRRRKHHPIHLHCHPAAIR
ncbi:MAG: lamin tail domain-containing protein [Chiayiivirga sp.]|jgi:hypothetical protein|nr:lamin tail domain-containing protein [Chiayiivirga sp.]